MLVQQQAQRLHDQYYFQTPRSTCSPGGSARQSSSSSARSKSLDYDLRNAPSYHHAVMRLLPHHSSAVTFQHHHHRYPTSSSAAAGPTSRPSAIPGSGHGHRACLCDPERRHYRKDWREDPHLLDGGTAAAASRGRTSSASPDTKLLHQFDTTAAAAADELSPDPPPRDCSKGSQFKSSTVYLEVKLAEMLSNNKDTREKTIPNVKAFKACWEVLGELSRMKTPFVDVFSKIYQELEKSIYSPYISAHTSTTPTFEQVPFFELVKKLESRKNEIDVERETLKANIITCQSEIGWVEDEIKELKENLKNAEVEANDTKFRLAATLEDLEAAYSKVSVR